MPRSRHPSPAAAEQFALRFRLLMSYHDLTLRDVAQATRSAISTVGTWKNGRMPSSERVVEKLAEVFQVSVEYLLKGRPALGGDPGPEAVERVAGQILDNLEILLASVEVNNLSTRLPDVCENLK